MKREESESRTVYVVELTFLSIFNGGVELLKYLQEVMSRNHFKHHWIFCQYYWIVSIIRQCHISKERVIFTNLLPLDYTRNQPISYMTNSF